MSYQAPFVDAATSVDPVNRENTFISYYSYGSVLGLALDLSLRQNGLNLDDFMKLAYEKFGKTENPYTVEDLHETLNQYAGKRFGDTFFNTYIHKSEMPDYGPLFESVGVVLAQRSNVPGFGPYVEINSDGTATVLGNPAMESPAYVAGLDKGDVITTINNLPLPKEQDFEEYLSQFKVGDALKINFIRYGKTMNTTLVLKYNPDYSMHLMEDVEQTPAAQMLKQRKAWLKNE